MILGYTEELFPTGMPDIWMFTAYSLGTKVVTTPNHILITEVVEIDDSDITANCQDLPGGSPDRGSMTLGNIVLLPGYFFYESSTTLRLTFLDADSNVIYAEKEAFYWKFAGRTLRRLSPAQRHRRLGFNSSTGGRHQPRLCYRGKNITATG